MCVCVYFSVHKIRNVTSCIYSTPGQVQFLDRHHLLIKFGSVDGGVSSLCNLYVFFIFIFLVLIHSP